jgi:Rho-binding antiterminator
MDEYKLVNCDFDDQLEEWSTLRQPCQLTYRNAEDELTEAKGLIVDIYAADKADYLKLDDGTVIRLDKIVTANGKKVDEYELKD